MWRTVDISDQFAKTVTNIFQLSLTHFINNIDVTHEKRDIYLLRNILR